MISSPSSIIPSAVELAPYRDTTAVPGTYLRTHMGPDPGAFANALPGSAPGRRNPEAVGETRAILVNGCEK